MTQRQQISVRDIDPAIAGRLHPDCWVGHTLGNGDITPYDDAPRASRSVGQLAVREINRYRQLAGGTIPLEVYREGDTFDAASHGSGTILSIRQEHLYGTAAFEPLDPADFEGIPPHKREHINSVGQPVATASPYFSYVNEMALGVVERTWRRQPSIIRGMTFVTLSAPGSLRIRKTNSAMPSPLVVGSVTHYEHPQNGIEMMLRAYEIAVLAHGRPLSRAVSIAVPWARTRTATP